MRRSVVRQNDFNQLCDRAGLSHAEAAALLSVSERTIARYANGTGHPSALGRRVLEEAARRAVQPPRQVSFRFIDLFAGIGGLRIGFQGIGGHCVFTSEWDANAQKTYAQNFRDNHPLAGDIREYAENPAKIPEHDVLLAGFPCQPFSIAGVSKKNALGRPHGFLCDTQGTLFFDTAQIIAHHRPAAFVPGSSIAGRHDRSPLAGRIPAASGAADVCPVGRRVLPSHPCNSGPTECA
jgi:DNA (cytosine-5)-methyltransferase 1